MRLILTSFVFATLFFAGCSDDDDSTAAGGSAGGGGTAMSIPFPAVGLLSVGGSHACLSETDGTTRCWGSGVDGRLGNNSTNGQSGPARVRSVEDGSGNGSAAAVTTAAGLLPGRTGIAHDYDPGSDFENYLDNIVQVSAGGSHTCGLGFDSILRCWGDNGEGQVGRIRLYVAAGGTGGFLADGGTSFNVAAFVYGPGDRSTTAGTLTPFTEAFYDVTQVGSGGSHTCAVYDTADETGLVSCWGLGQQGQLGVNNLLPSPGTANASADSPQPVALDDANSATDVLSDIIQVAAGGQHSCALSEDGDVYCWGGSTAGRPELGVGTVNATLGNTVLVASTDAPVQVVNVSGDSGNLGMVTQIVAGTSHTCALSSGGNVYCWGLDQQGQLGAGGGMASNRDVGAANASADTPLQVINVSGDSGNLSGIIQITAGANHTCALSSSRRVYCWGQDNLGQLGAGGGMVTNRGVGPAAGVGAGNIANYTHSSSDVPVAVVDVSGDGGQGRQGTLANVVGIAAGGDNTCALQSTGRVVCWGSNDNDELGTGISEASLVPGGASSDVPVTVRANAYLPTPYEYR